MKAHIITIGEEILVGQTLNTNAAFIGAELDKLDVDIRKTSAVGDVESEIIDELKYACENNDVVIVTGGLGPTHDDVTKNAVVKFFNTELVMNEEVLGDIKELFLKRNREMSKVNEYQAMVPKNCEVIRNQKGTAPGMWIEDKGKIFISMPGVPYEMREMMSEFVVPRLIEKIGEPKSFVRTVAFQSTGIPESTLYERLGNLEELLGGAKMAFLPNQFGVKLKIIVRSDSEEMAVNKLSGIEQKVRSIVGRYIYGKNDETLEEVVSRLLKERGIKIAVSESCTGGLISNRLTNIAGSSAFFERGVVTYSNAAKVELLKVDEDYIAEHGAVSLEVARQMAEGVRATSGNDIGLAVTGIMGPTGATEDKPVGLVYIGICDDKICTAKEFRFGDDRILNKERTAQAALEMLRRHLLGIPYDE